MFGISHFYPLFSLWGRLQYQGLLCLVDSNRWRGLIKYYGLLTRSIYLTALTKNIFYLTACSGVPMWSLLKIRASSQVQGKWAETPWTIEAIIWNKKTKNRFRIECFTNKRRTCSTVGIWTTDKWGNHVWSSHGPLTKLWSEYQSFFSSVFRPLSRAHWFMMS